MKTTADAPVQGFEVDDLVAARQHHKPLAKRILTTPWPGAKKLQGDDKEKVTEEV